MVFVAIVHAEPTAEAEADADAFYGFYGGPRSFYHHNRFYGGHYPYGGYRRTYHHYKPSYYKKPYSPYYKPAPIVKAVPAPAPIVKAAPPPPAPYVKSVPATPVKPVHHDAPVHPNLRAVAPAPAPPAPAAPSTVYEEPIQYEQQVYAEAPGAPVLKAYEAVPDLPLPAQEAYEAPVEAPAPIAAPKPVAYETPAVVQVSVLTLHTTIRDFMTWIELNWSAIFKVDCLLIGPSLGNLSHPWLIRLKVFQLQYLNTLFQNKDAQIRRRLAVRMIDFYAYFHTKLSTFLAWHERMQRENSRAWSVQENYVYKFLLW